MKYEVYCDESRQEYFSRPIYEIENKFVMIGGIWIKAEERELIKSHIKDIRAKHNLFGEFKWNRVSPSKINFYKDIIQLFFHQEIRFRCLVLPAEKLDRVEYHGDDAELMFYKFYYLMLHHWIYDSNSYSIFVDQKTNAQSNRINELRRILRNANLFATVEDVQALPSNEVDLLQLADILIGAVGHHFNADGNSEAKKSIIELIEFNIGHKIQPTSKNVNKFNIFKWRPERKW